MVFYKNTGNVFMDEPRTEMDPELACLVHAFGNQFHKSVRAYHEAGHAVVACFSENVELVDVSIDADEKGVGRTNVKLYQLEPGIASSPLTPSQRRDIEDSIKSLLGGQVAERHFQGPEYTIQCDMGWGDDNQRIAEYLKCIGVEQLPKLKAKTERDIEANWGFVEAVARALFEKTRLSGAEVEGIYKELTRSA